MNDGTGLYKKLIIKEIREEVKDFKTILFEDGHGINYLPGQYLTFIHNEGNEEIRRSYSITSSPVLNEGLSIGVKRVENGVFSRQLVDHAKPGDQLLTTGAGGFFTLPEDIENYGQVFFLAAGSGITPIYSLLKTVLWKFKHLSSVLIFSNPSVTKAIFYNQLKQFAEEFNSRFKLEFLFSNTPDLSKARLYRELLMHFYNKHVGEVNRKTLFYICGPESYMRMCTYVLQEAHVPKENIKKENFFSHHQKVYKALPPDQDPHRVTIYLSDKQYSFEVQYPDTILQTAKKNSISLPYSCEAGICGNCVAKCKEGKMWLSNNEVLTDKDLANGLTLTCVGHPVGSDVVLEIK
jgi:ring-1,2-phenylacetyl-CoA epoxidase subunit PaaE